MQAQRSDFRRHLEEALEWCGLPPDLASEIEDRLVPVTYEKGAVIFLRGAPSELLFWLLKGIVKLYLPHEDGNRTLIDLARPGDLLGFINAREPNCRRHLLEAQALTRCSVGLVSRDQIAQLVGKLDGISAIRLLEELNVAWSTMFERYVSFLAAPFRLRLEMVLKRLGERFGIEDKRGTLLVPELSHEDLAEMIGSSRPMVSKLLSDMTEEGLLTQGERRHFILRTRETSTATPDAVGSLVRFNGDTKMAENTHDHGRAQASLTFLSRSERKNSPALLSRHEKGRLHQNVQ